MSTPRFSLFGRYLLLERLAVGGMAEVYLAKRFETDGEVSELVAVKRILPSLAEDQGFIRMFLDEAKIAGRLEHPGIVRIQELGRVGRSHYLAMDFVWGKDLLAIIRRCRLLGARLPPAFVAFLGAQMCEALHAAHTARDRHGRPMNVIHRDVSPQNVLVSFDGVVKLIDFGIAKAQARLTQTQSGMLKGKVAYMSPEQVRDGRVGLRSDLFAVGTCLYELLTLRALFGRDSPFDTMEAVREAKPVPIRERRPDVPEALAAILAKALAADPDDRWSSGEAMQRALEGFLADEGHTDPRGRTVTWIRDAFRKELFEERHRLDALDQLGRRQLTPADEPHRNSITELEIPPEETLPDAGWESGDTAVHEHEPPWVGIEAPEPDDAPTEVFFSQSNPPPEVSESSEPSVSSDDIALDPRQLSSGMIERIAPSPTEKRRVAREPTARQRIPDPAIEPPKGGGGANIGRRAAVGLLLLAAGAAGTYAWSQITATAEVEVRTHPSVGGVVLLDGVNHGPPPVRLENVAPGHHVLTIVAPPGYSDVTREIELEGNSTAHLDVALEELP